MMCLFQLKNIVIAGIALLAACKPLVRPASSLQDSDDQIEVRVMAAQGGGVLAYCPPADKCIPLLLDKKDKDKPYLFSSTSEVVNKITQGAAKQSKTKKLISVTTLLSAVALTAYVLTKSKALLQRLEVIEKLRIRMLNHSRVAVRMENAEEIAATRREILAVLDAFDTNDKLRIAVTSALEQDNLMSAMSVVVDAVSRTDLIAQQLKASGVVVSLGLSGGSAAAFVGDLNDSRALAESYDDLVMLFVEGSSVKFTRKELQAVLKLCAKHLGAKPYDTKKLFKN